MREYTTDYNRRTGLSADVHRFRGNAAIHVGTGETASLTPKQARALARALYKAARDTDNRAFSESEVAPVQIDIN